MDVSDASYYIQENNENNENKGSQMGHTKKIFKKTTLQNWTLAKLDQVFTIFKIIAKLASEWPWLTY